VNSACRKNKRFSFLRRWI